MVSSFAVAVYFEFFHERLGFGEMDPTLGLVLGVAVTTVCWVFVTFITPPTATGTLRAFYQQIRPMGPGWNGFRQDAIEGKSRKEVGPAAKEDSPAAAFMGWFLACVTVYGALLGTGYCIYGRYPLGVTCLAVATGAGIGLIRIVKNLGVLGRGRA